jgi:hypothetical protein
MCPEFSLSLGQIDAAKSWLLHANVLSMKHERFDAFLLPNYRCAELHVRAAKHRQHAHNTACKLSNSSSNS